MIPVSLQSKRARRISFAFMSCLFPLLGGCNWLVLVDRSMQGGHSNSNSNEPSISADGRYIAFTSTASNLIPEDNNYRPDIFVRDLRNETTIRVSVDSGGNESIGYSYTPSISGDGQHVAFSSSATDLVSGITNNFSDVFVHDIKTGKTTRVSVDSQGNEADGKSSYSSISHDGRFVAFESTATNLVEGDTNESSDIFVHDRNTGNTIRASVSSTGVPGDRSSTNPKISADGSVITFESRAGTLDPEKEENANIGSQDIFTHVLATGVTTLVSVDNEGKRGGRWSRSSAYPAISEDGRYIAFQSHSFFDEDPYVNRNAIYLRDTVANTTVQLTKGINGEDVRGSSFTTGMSYDGRYIAFLSGADNLTENDSNLYTDCFIADTKTGSTAMVSAGALGDPNIGWADSCALAGYGRYATFSARNSFLTDDDDRFTKGLSAVFVRATPEPAINLIEPNRLPIGETTSITISGVGFRPGANIRLQTQALLPFFFSDISVSNLVRVDENTMTLDLFVAPSANPEDRSILAIVPGTGPGPNTGASSLCENCITLY